MAMAIQSENLSFKDRFPLHWKVWENDYAGVDAILKSKDTKATLLVI